MPVYVDGVRVEAGAAAVDVTYDNSISGLAGTNLQDTTDELSDAVDTLDADKLDKELVEEIDYWEEEPAAHTVVLVQYAEFACTIDRITVLTSAGTLTLAVQIDGVDVTAMDAIAVTSVEQTVTATGANDVAVGATVTAVISAPAGGAADLAFTIRTTRV